LTGLLLLTIGISLLFLGGELLVRNAPLLARALGMPPLVVGLTVVAFGTSAPELAAALAAALSGAPGIAYGNVVGSNIANLGLILVLAVLIRPLRVEARFLLREAPFMVAVALLLALAVWDGVVDRWEGTFFLLLLGGYLYLLLGDREPPEIVEEFAEAYGAGARHIAYRLFLLGLGVALLVLGARSLVAGAVALAAALGVPDRVIGLSVVAIGTSLPELAAALVAALRREGDILLGNLIGSNIFNVLGILGTVALVRPLALATVPLLDLAALLGFSLLTWLFLWTGRRLGRREGVLLFALYLSYTVGLYS